MQLTIEWRRELRTGRCAKLRRLACAERANARIQPFAADPMAKLVRFFRLKWIEGRLCLAKNWLKISVAAKAVRRI